MGKTKKSQIRVSFIGGNAEAVTGSMTLVESKEFKILLEAGLIQSNNLKDDYYANRRKLPFKPKDLDYIFIGHIHADHALLIPRLVTEGFVGKIIAPKGSAQFFRIMSLDSAFIMSKDVEALQQKYGLSLSPIYTSDDAAACMPLFEEYDFNQKVELNSNISFRFVPAGHIIQSAQCELWLTIGNHTKKILMTSDLGNICCEKFYTNEFEPVQKANLAIVETTYSDTVRAISRKDRIKDLEKMKTVIQNVCVENQHKVLIPIFSLDRCQNIMTHLYNLFHEDESFDIPILIDSPLAQKMCKLYSSLLEGEQLEQWERVLGWKNFRFPAEYADSKQYMDSQLPCVCCAASGFMAAGRSRQWAKVLLPDSKSHILFVGFATENALAGKIKYGSEQKTIKIDGKQYKNRCGVSDLKSFSSHMQREDMMNYYSSIDCEKIALVHGNMKSKLEFAKDLQEEISRKNRTSKVVCINRSTEILL